MTSVIHQTDIFHPHGDPDDHWDLATVYALAARGDIALQGVIMDYPPPHRAGDPATLAMAQLGQLTGITGIPFAIGSRHPLRSRTDRLSDQPATSRAAAEWLCRALDASLVPIVINVVGSSTDVAVAGLLRPDLFESKCRAIYLNSGAAHPGKAGELEYNVRLNPDSYAAIFDLPCPIYWCPCWHRTEMREVGTYGTWYSFVQQDILNQLSDPLRNYFLYMLSRSTDPQYLRYLHQPVDPALSTAFGPKRRSMWSTAAILHAAGMGVDVEKGLASRDQVRDPVFEFTPITITCADDGATTWAQAPGKSNRYIFHIRHTDRYAVAMQAALCQVLAGIVMPVCG